MFPYFLCKTAFGGRKMIQMCFYEIIFKHYYLNSIFAAKQFPIIPEKIFTISSGIKSY